MSNTAYLQIRTNMLYRNEVFREGVERAGYKWDIRPPKIINPGDILLVWNRYSSIDRLACRFEEAGLPVIVVENSYLDMVRSKKAFAMSLNRHNGGGKWPQRTTADRSELLNVEVRPWKTGGKYVLILPQRGIGMPPVAMPRNWAAQTEKRLKSMGVPCRIRVHPELLKRDAKGREHRTLEQDLEGAYAAVVWASSAGLKAMLAGVPVFHEYEDWIGGSPAACYGIGNLRNLEPGKAHELMGDRRAMLQKVACAQWCGEEVRSGMPISWLVDLHYNPKRHEEYVMGASFYESSGVWPGRG